MATEFLIYNTLYGPNFVSHRPELWGSWFIYNYWKTGCCSLVMALLITLRLSLKIMAKLTLQLCGKFQLKISMRTGSPPACVSVGSAAACTDTVPSLTAVAGK